MTVSLVCRCAPLVLPLLATSVAHAQNDAKVQAEIEFARGLASEWAFVDLAETVLDGAEREASGGKTTELLGVVRCELSAAGAANERDPVKRNELFDQALNCFSGYLEANPLSEYRSRAESELVSASARYAFFLEQDLEEAAGEEAVQMRQRQAEVLNTAVVLTSELIAGLESLGSERSQSQSRELHDLMLQKGQMLATIGRSDPSTTFFFDQAVTAYENLVFEVGDGTLYALRAYSGIGDVYAYQEMWDEAAAYYEAVVETTIPIEPEDWAAAKRDYELTPADVQLRFNLLELSLPGLVEALRNAGDSENALRYSMHFLNTYRMEGVTLSPQGSLALLDVARTLLDSSGYVGGDFAKGEAVWFATEEEMKDAVKNRRQHNDTTSLAMSLATEVADENPGSILRTYAQKLIADISSRPGVSVSPELQLSAAEGELRSGNLDASLAILNDLRATLDAGSEDQRLSLGGKVLQLTGNAYRQQGRLLEAAMAYREGVATYAPGDDVVDSDNARYYRFVVVGLSKAAKEAPGPLEELVAEAEDFVIRYPSEGGDPSSINWGRADNLYNDGEFELAIQELEKIEPGTLYWEKAQVQVAVNKVRLKRLDEAIADLDRYLEETVVDPANATEDSRKLQKRAEAIAIGEFFRGLCYYMKKDHAKVIELVSTYHEDFDMSKWGQFGNWTMDMTMRSHLALDQRSEARDVLYQMMEDFGDSERTAAAIVSFYNVLKGMQEEATDPERKRALLTEMAEMLETNNRIKTPDFAELTNEASHWMELQEWAKAEVALTRLIERFGEDPEHQETIQTYRVPDLGHALVLQKKVADAKAVLQPLVIGENAKPYEQTLMDFAMATTGWLEHQDGRVVEVPGAGGTDEEFEAIQDKLNAFANSRKYAKWIDPEWYEIKFRFVFTYYAWSKQDSRKQPIFEQKLGEVFIGISEDWDSIQEAVDRSEDENLKARLGDGKLVDWYRWLAAR